MKSTKVLRKASLALLLIFLTGLLYIPVPVAADTDEREWRPMVARSQEQFEVSEADFPYFYEISGYGGEGMQFMHGADVNADGTVAMGQDMGAVRVSTDFGRTWYTPANEGNPHFAAQAIAIDPEDSNVIYAEMSGGWRSVQFPELRPTEGIYRSADKGESWKLVQSVPFTNYSLRWYKDNFACYPVTGGQAESRIWRLIVHNYTNTAAGTGTFWASDPGGETWTKVYEFPSNNYGNIYALEQHPTEINTLYLCASGGIWMTVNGGSVWTRPSWGSFVNTASRSLWIEPEKPEHMIVSVAAGIYETFNGGNSWKSIFDAAANNITPGHMAVGAPNAYGQRMIYLHNSKSGTSDPGRIRKFDGTWISPELEPVDPSAWAQGSLGGYPQSAFLAHPTIPDLCLSHGRAFWWRSEGNEGALWTYSSTNYFGTPMIGAAFDENNWEVMDFAVNDLGTIYTTTGGDWIVESNVTAAQLARMDASVKLHIPGRTLTVRTGTSIVRLPDPWPSDVPPPVDPDAPGRVLAIIGNNLSFQFIFSKDKGETEWKDWIEEPIQNGGGPAKRTRLLVSRQNPNIIYTGSNISTDGGATWNPVSNPVLGMSWLDGDIIYSVPNAAGLTSYPVTKSTDRGQTRTTIYTLNHRPTDPDGTVFMYTDPNSDQRLYTVSPNKDVYLLKQGDDGIWSGTDLNLRGEYAEATRSLDWEIKDIKVDPSDSRLIYVLVNVQGAPLVWRGYFDADFAGINWEDITENAPPVGAAAFINLHPVTGDLILGGGNGNFVFPAPSGWQHKDPSKRQYKRALWNNLPHAVPNKCMDSYIGDEDIYSTSVTLHWTPVEGATGYKLLQFDRYGAKLQAAYDVPASTSEYTFEGLEPAISYSFRVMAKKSAGFTHASLVRNATTRVLPLIDRMFSLEGLSLSGSSRIIGDTGTNSSAAGSVCFTWSSGIDGDLFLGPEAVWEEAVKSDRPDARDNVTGEISTLSSEREYPLPQFPEIPELESKGDLNAGWWPAGLQIIDESGSYGSIVVENLLTVNVGDEDSLISADRLSVKGSGKIVVNRTGTGRLILYVADEFELSGSGKVNSGGSFDDVIMYYAGDGELAFEGNTVFNGSVFAKGANAVIGGFGGVTGHIVTGGEAVSVTGNASANTRVVYAPNAILTVSGSGKITGAAIARSIILSGAAQIKYSDSINTGFFEKLDWPEPKPLPIPDGEEPTDPTDPTGTNL